MRLELADGRFHRVGQQEAIAKAGCQFGSTRLKRLYSHAVNELHRTSRPGWKANAKNGSDIGIMHRGQHIFRQAARRLHRLAVQQAVFEVGDVPLCIGFLKQWFELWPQVFFGAVFRLFFGGES